MKTLKKASLVLMTVCALVLCTVLCAVNASAAGVRASGKCGDNLTWVLDTETGVLTIYGEGGMPNWYMETTPFGGSAAITEVVVEEGVSNIGRYGLGDCTQLQKGHSPRVWRPFGGVPLRVALV